MPETFNFPYHMEREKWPDDFRVTFGGGYTYAPEPSSPAQRTFTLKFNAMKFFVDGSGNVDASVSPELNMQALLDFYSRHRMWKNFTYPHPRHGNITVKFGAPMDAPEPIPGGLGAVSPFEISLVEQPL